MIIILLFWTAIALVFYAYSGYPLLLKLLSIFLSNPIRKEQFVSNVTLIISVYNEENVIAQKIENSLNLDYPKEKFEIMVVSDASTDATEKIVESYSYRGVKILRIEGRVGKTSCLNKAVPEATGEIIIFSDANSFYDRNAIRKIVENFSDEKVGCVTGYTEYFTKSDDITNTSIGIYTRIEKLTKVLESRVGSCIGADGAIFAIRKNLYIPLRSTDINDFVIPLQIVKRGYRTVFEETAVCREETAANSKGEFFRQVRITNRTLRAIFNNKELLNAFRYKLFSFKLISHKLLKYLVPMLLVMAILSNLALARGRQLYKWIFCLQVIFYGIASIHVDNTHGLFGRFRSISRTFLVTNAAIIYGWITYLKGDYFTTWNTNR